MVQDRIDAALDALASRSDEEFLRLALACVDQASFSEANRAHVRRLLERISGISLADGES